MRKQFLALATLALSVNALAASTTTLTTSTKKLSLGKFLDSTKASIYYNAEKQDTADNVTTHTQYLILTNTVNSDISTRLELRANISDAESTERSTTRNRVMIDPRFTVNAFRTTLNTNAGEITISPQLRTQIAINESAENKYATFRLGAVASMNTSSYNNLAAYVGLYETATKTNATRAAHEASNLYVWVADTYSINDNHSFTALYEIFGNINQDTLSYANPTRQNDFSIYYNNSSIKNLSLSPYIAQNMADKASLDVLRVGVDATYSF